MKKVDRAWRQSGSETMFGAPKMVDAGSGVAWLRDAGKWDPFQPAKRARENGPAATTHCQVRGIPLAPPPHRGTAKACDNLWGKRQP